MPNLDLALFVSLLAAIPAWGFASTARIVEAISPPARRDRVRHARWLVR